MNDTLKPDVAPTDGLEAAAFKAFAASVCAGAFSLPLGRALLVVSFVLLAAHLVQRRQRPRLPAVFWIALLFFLITAVATIFGINPARGVPKLHKFVWFMGIPVGAVLVQSGARVRMLVKAYAVGAGVLVFELCGGHAWKALKLVQAGKFAHFSDGLVQVGSMTDGQRLMIGLLLALGLLLAAPAADRRERLRWLGLLLWIGFGLLVNFKRGSWICTAGVAGAFLVVRAGWRYAVLVLAVALSLLAVPTVRTRLAGLQDELGARGGRLTMWTKIAPVLIREHPWGIGYRALTNDMMRRIVPKVERDRDHLHSNPIQILVESGWLGLAAYLLWMGWGVADAWRCHRRLRADAALAACSLALCFALIALLANGLVEYNMGDAEIVLAYGFILGSCAGIAKTARPDASPHLEAERGA